MNDAKIQVKPINYIFGLFLSFSLVAGRYYENDGALPLSNPTFYLLIIGVALVISGLSAVLFARIKEYAEARKKKCATEVLRDETTKDSERTVRAGHAAKGIFLISFLIIFVLYFIVFLGVYPGFFVYDAQYELTETITRSFTSQQPILHVLFMGLIVQGVHSITDNYNTAIAVFILIQMTLVSLCWATLIRELNKDMLSKKGAIVFSIYLGLFPVPVMFSLCSAKDGLFGACIIILFILTRRIIDDFAAFIKNRRQVILFVLFSVLMMMLRPNGVYAYILFAMVLVLFLVRCKHESCKDSAITAMSDRVDAENRSTAGRKNIFIFGAVLILSVCISLFANKFLLWATHAENYGVKDALSMPIQQMARLYSYDKDTLTASEIDEITAFIPEEALKRYNPKCADPVKIDFNEEAFSASPLEFIKLWIRLGIKHPGAYINAQGMTSYGLWYPGATIDGYKGNQVFTFVYGDSSYFGYETEEPGVRNSYIPFIDSFYKWISLDPTIQKIPVISLLFAPGFVLWIVLFCICYFIYIGQGSKAIPYLLAMFVLLTCLIGPMSLVRYSFFLWILAPVCLCSLRHA